SGGSARDNARGQVGLPERRRTAPFGILTEDGHPAPHRDWVTRQREQRALRDTSQPHDQDAVRTVVYEPTGADLFKPLDQHRHPRHARAQEVSQRRRNIEVDRSRGRPQRLHLFRKVRNRGVLADALQSCLGHEVQQKAGEARPRDMAGQALHPQLRVQGLAHERSRQPPLSLDGDRVARGDHALLIGIAIEVAGLRVRRPVRILLATDVMVRHRTQKLVTITITQATSFGVANTPAYACTNRRRITRRKGHDRIKSNETEYATSTKTTPKRPTWPSAKGARSD